MGARPLRESSRVPGEAWPWRFRRFAQPMVDALLTVRIASALAQTPTIPVASEAQRQMGAAGVDF